MVIEVLTPPWAGIYAYGATILPHSVRYHPEDVFTQVNVAMEPDSLPTELILSHAQQPLGQLYLDWMPQPGARLDFEGKTYQVLERRHRYQLKANRYQLHRVALYVQTAPLSEEVSFIDDRWIIGDASCRFNARSELVRCAVRPHGPCEGCPEYQSHSDEGASS